MRFNPSLTSRLRIGFIVLFALLLLVSLVGVGRLFQVRVNYEDDITRSFQIELESEGLRSAFILEQAAVRPAVGQKLPSQAELNRAAANFAGAVARGQRNGLAAIGRPTADSWKDPQARSRAASDSGGDQQRRRAGDRDAERS